MKYASETGSVTWYAYQVSWRLAETVVSGVFIAKQQGDLINLFLFSQNKESRLKTELSRNVRHFNIFAIVGVLLTKVPLVLPLMGRCAPCVHVLLDLISMCLLQLRDLVFHFSWRDLRLILYSCWYGVIRCRWPVLWVLRRVDYWITFDQLSSPLTYY
jgi:hypothetical protein